MTRLKEIEIKLKELDNLRNEGNNNNEALIKNKNEKHELKKIDLMEETMNLENKFKDKELNYKHEEKLIKLKLEEELNLRKDLDLQKNPHELRMRDLEEDHKENMQKLELKIEDDKEMERMKKDYEKYINDNIRLELVLKKMNSEHSFKMSAMEMDKKFFEDDIKEKNTQIEEGHQNNLKKKKEEYELKREELKNRLIKSLGGNKLENNFLNQYQNNFQPMMYTPVFQLPPQMAPAIPNPNTPGSNNTTKNAQFPPIYQTNSPYNNPELQYGFPPTIYYPIQNSVMSNTYPLSYSYEPSAPNNQNFSYSFKPNEKIMKNYNYNIIKHT
jgi:hypothetical protein